MPSYIAFFFFSFSFISSSAGRRILHQPFFPVDSSPAPAAQPPLLPPSQPKYPFSSLSPPTKQNPFFPFSYLSPPPPPPAGSVATFPANISSLVLPETSHSKPISRKLVAVAVSLSLLSAALITAVAAFLLHHNSRRSFSHHKASRTDSLRLVPPDAAPSDGGQKTPRNVSGAGSEFLYLGTLRGISEEERESHKATNSSSPGASSMPSYERLGSPELHPLPPLPRQNLRRGYPADNDVEDDNDEFFSPRESPPKENFVARGPNSRSASYPSSNSGSPANSTSCSLDLSPRSLRSKSPDSAVSFPAPSRPPPPVPARVAAKLPPPPPPPPPRFWEIPGGPPVLVTPSGPAASQNPEPGSDSGSEKGKKMETLVRTEEAPKPKLKPLHWDKVRASSDRAMVWDQLKSSSFQLNEEMIETLFTVNSSSSTVKESAWQRVPPMANQENRVLDPKKSQNIAILLRALNVTIDEVCEALLEGSADTMGTELLESLLKMAPTKEEERKLKDFRDESPFKLGPAEKFLKAVLDIPFAFQRVDAMLYMANFDSEVDYLKRSFETLEAACEELRKSKMFLKLLEAVLKAGNRMNVGTNRGDAHAFKLDTLLKLVDVKGTDGKTTLLHFVVQEISRAEGSRLAGANQSPTDKNQQSSLQDEIEFRKLGLQVVSSLSGELTNVKKAAAMDADVLSNEVTKLAKGIDKIREVSRLNGEAAAVEAISTQKFSESMNEFLKKAEAEIGKIEEGERVAISLVTEITKYFHGDSAKEEAHRFRIFTVVRDFLSILDQVCKEVGKINERRTVSPIRQFPLPASSNLPPVFPGLVSKPHFGSSDDENSSS